MRDRFRPRTWDEVVGQPTEQVRALLDGERSPNFLFYGPPGTGKTTTAHLISREIQGSVEELMEFNASDDRGIDVIREEIIPVVNQTTLSGAPRVIFLDEMESMTGEAQEALRQPMEQGKAVFVLACNDVSRVREALKSRCYDLKFGPVEPGAIKERVRQLATSDGVDLDGDQLRRVVSHADGDMRSALQQYESFARGAYAPEGDEPATAADGSAFERSARDFLQEGGS